MLRGFGGGGIVRTRLRFVLGGLVACVAGCGAPAAPPDVALVVVDTLRADHLGTYAFPLPTSPHVDRFAAGAVVFERALAASSNTVPSHASLMTSRFVREHSVGKVPLIFVVGKREAEEGTVSVRRLGTEGQKVEPFMDALVALMAEATAPDLKEKAKAA